MSSLLTFTDSEMPDFGGTMYHIVVTKKFRKDWRRLKKSVYTMHKLVNTLRLLADGKFLPTHNQAHSLKGRFQGMQECHIEPNWLFIYE